eukprot:1331274-Amphidinium_carterae.1
MYPLTLVARLLDIVVVSVWWQNRVTEKCDCHCLCECDTKSTPDLVSCLAAFVLGAGGVVATLGAWRNCRCCDRVRHPPTADRGRETYPSSSLEAIARQQTAEIIARRK